MNPTLRRVRTTRTVLAAMAAGAVALVAAACVPPATGSGAPPPTTLPDGAVTVSYVCQGVGFAQGPPLPAQDVDIALTAPSSVAPGEVVTLTADLSPLSLTATSAIDLNALGMAGKVALDLTGATGADAVGAPVYFAGATAYIPSADSELTVTATSGGTVEIEAGQISIIYGSTGFVCALDPGTTPAAISIPVV